MGWLGDDRLLQGKEHVVGLAAVTRLDAVADEARCVIRPEPHVAVHFGHIELHVRQAAALHAEVVEALAGIEAASEPFPRRRPLPPEAEAAAGHHDRADARLLLELAEEPHDDVLAVADAALGESTVRAPRRLHEQEFAQVPDAAGIAMHDGDCGRSVFAKRIVSSDEGIDVGQLGRIDLNRIFHGRLLHKRSAVRIARAQRYRKQAASPLDWPRVRPKIRASVPTGARGTCRRTSPAYCAGPACQR
jgi:hypothetical protein